MAAESRVYMNANSVSNSCKVIAGAVGQQFGRPFLFATLRALTGFLMTPQPFVESRID